MPVGMPDKTLQGSCCHLRLVAVDSLGLHTRHAGLPAAAACCLLMSCCYRLCCTHQTALQLWVCCTPLRSISSQRKAALLPAHTADRQ